MDALNRLHETLAAILKVLVFTTSLACKPYISYYSRLKEVY